MNNSASHLPEISPVESEAAPARDLETAHAEPKLPSLLGYPATYLLLGINFLVFLFMFRHNPAITLFREHAWRTPRASFDWASSLHFAWDLLNAQFDGNTLLRFGGSYTPLVLAGEWWRLVAASFVHVTILHLLINMWCLWNLGLFGEPLLGKPGLIAVYLLTGTAGMTLSLAWSVFAREPGIVAGASGAVFGLAGILIVLLSNRRLSLPWEELRSLRRSVIWFSVLNLAVGIVPQLLPSLPGALLTPLHVDAGSLPRIDNRAHLGGFLSGLALGLPLFPRMTSGKSSYRARQALVFGCAALLLCLLAYGLAAFAA